MERHDTVWKEAALARTFLEGVRGGIPFATEQIAVMLRLIAASQVPVRCLADLGCGGGALAAAVLAQYPAAHATLVDFSEPMIAAARARLGARRPPSHFLVADLAASDWRDAVATRAPFDAVVSGFAIHHLTDGRKRELYGEILALLSPGGIFVNIEHVASHSPWGEALSDEMMIDSLYAFHAARGSERTRAQVADEFVHRPDKAANILAPVETQCEWLRAWGFVDVDCYFKAFELAVFAGRRPAA